jgi:hypothetical protein
MATKFCAAESSPCAPWMVKSASVSRRIHSAGVLPQAGSQAGNPFAWSTPSTISATGQGLRTFPAMLSRESSSTRATRPESGRKNRRARRMPVIARGQ